jgi:hypothetical protein
VNKNQNLKTPATINYQVQQDLNQYLSDDDKEWAARSRRAAKAVTYGQYNLNELIEQLNQIVKTKFFQYLT